MDIISLDIPKRLRTASSRLLNKDGLSIDGLDVAIRGLAMLTVVILSISGYGHTEADYPALVDGADPLAVAMWLVLYNLAVIAVVGVPWRRAPGFPLFVVDWAVASVAILLTGGSFSPFIVLYYALAIGAALRVGLSRSLMLVVGCGLVFTALSLATPIPAETVKLPVLVVQITSLAMVVATAVGLKHTVEVEAKRVELEEATGRQIRLLNNMTNSVLSASPELDKVLRTIALASKEALRADSALVAVGNHGRHLPDQASGPSSATGLVLVADDEPNPVCLSEDEQRLLRKAAFAQSAVSVEGRGDRASLARYPGLEDGSFLVKSVLCAPLLLGNENMGAIFAARYVDPPFVQNEADLLTAIGQRMALALRLTRLYEIEHEKALRSEERERLERDLLSMVSHELRTPLTSIKTSAEALSSIEREGGSRAIEERLLRNISRSTDRLINLVDEMLDMARFRAGRVSLNMQQLNLGDVIQEIAAQVGPILDTRKQALTIDLPSPHSSRWERLTALADRRRIEQVLLNLIANAHKYGPEGGTITLGATPRDGGVRVFVRDEGPGMSRHEQIRVFEKFYRGETASAQANGKQDSLGLGLAIARSIVELHGGTIGVSSKPGHGSLFFFTLPQETEPRTMDDGRWTTDDGGKCET
jgi:signal transduction histidine kinase